MTGLHFVHCRACRLPSSPSGRCVWVDGMEARGAAIAQVCASVAHMRRVEATWPSEHPLSPTTAVLLGEIAGP